MAKGFFATVTTAAIGKAVTTKDKLLIDIDLQKQAAQAQLEYRSFKPKSEAKREFSVWFFQRSDGWWTYLRAGHTPIHINGEPIIRAGDTLEAVIGWYDQAGEAIRAGDLDEEIEEAITRRSQAAQNGKNGSEALDGDEPAPKPRKRKAKEAPVEAA